MVNVSLIVTHRYYHYIFMCMICDYSADMQSLLTFHIIFTVQCYA